MFRSRKSLIFILLLFFAFGLLKSSHAVVRISEKTSISTPKQLWERFQKTLSPFRYTIQKDEIVMSDTDPEKKLRRIDFAFSSQEVVSDDLMEKKKLWHKGVIFIPADPGILNNSARRGKVVIVGGLVGPFRQSFLSNYGDPIATRTGYPTMILPVPGETEDRPGKMYSQRLLIKYRRIHPDPVNHSHFRWAVPYLRALDVMAEVLKVDKCDIRAVIGGHSKRATAAHTAAAIDLERIVGVVFMGNESLHPEGPSSPWWVVSPYYTQRYVRCPVFYVGVTNEGGYAMFNINKIQAHMDIPWTFEIIPNYRHASESEKQFLAWQMWVSHIFDGRPLAMISDLSYEETENGTRFFARIDSPNKMILANVWYVYCDDVPYWRDLVWYPTPMRKEEGNLYEAYLPGKIPDAWLVEVQDTAKGFRGYVSSLPQNITHKAVAKRPGGGFPRLWEPKKESD